jgi:hypothetical protein
MGGVVSDKKKFSCNQLDDNEFKKDGWRPFFECRDLGIEEATDRTFFFAHVIRAVLSEHLVTLS